MTHLTGDDAAGLAVALRARVPLVLGSLRVWGASFGRPGDNIHTAVAVEAIANALVVRFEAGEELTVEDPGAWSLGQRSSTRPTTLRVGRAGRVTWEWYAYGRPKQPEHRYRDEHWLEDGQVRATSTADWYTRAFAPHPSLPAVEFL